MDVLKAKFMTSLNYSVIGASTNTEKYGYKVFKWYLDHKLKVYPIHVKEKSICNVNCYPNITSLLEKLTTKVENKTLKDNKPLLSISIITPPKITLGLFKEIEQNIKKYNNMTEFKNHDIICWVQPGAENEECKIFSEKNNMKVIYGCVLKDGDCAINSKM